MGKTLIVWVVSNEKLTLQIWKNFEKTSAEKRESKF